MNCVQIILALILVIYLGEPDPLETDYNCEAASYIRGLDNGVETMDMARDSHSMSSEGLIQLCTQVA